MSKREDRLTEKQISTILDFVHSYSFNDKQEYYTNGSEIVQVFRVEQALRHYKNGKCEMYLG